VGSGPDIFQRQLMVYVPSGFHDQQLRHAWQIDFWLFHCEQAGPFLPESPRMPHVHNEYHGLTEWRNNS